MSKPERLIASLTRRVRLFEQGNPSAVLDPRALSEASELTRRSTRGDGTVPVEVARVVARLHWCRHLARPNGTDLRAALALFTQVLSVDAQAVPEQVRQYLASAAAADLQRKARAAADLLQQGMYADNPVALNQAIQLLTATVADTPASNPDRAGMLSNLGLALQVRFERAGDAADLDDAVQAGRGAVDAIPSDDPNRAAMLINLSLALHTRYKHTAAEADLDDAVEAGREAVIATLIGHPDRAGRLSILGRTLQARFERSDVGADLDDAVDADREAVDTTPAGHPDRVERLHNLGYALLIRFERTGADADLDEAVHIRREAVNATPAGHPDRARMLSSLGIVLHTRFERAGVGADLDEAVRVTREAVAGIPVSHLGRAAILSHLSSALRSRFKRMGTGTDLDEAVQVSREAVAATPADHPDRAMCLSNLAAALGTRFEHSRAGADLDEAIRVGQEAANAAPGDDSYRAAILNNLGIALRMRFERTGSGADLDESVRVTRNAVDITPANHPDRAGRLSMLGTMLDTRFKRSGADADLNEAVRVSREAVRAIPTGHHGRATALSNLGIALHTRFERTGAATDLDEAVEVGREAADAVPASHPDRALYLYNLGHALHTRFRHSRAATDFDEAVRGWVQACGSTLAPATTRLAAAHQWAQATAKAQGPTAAVEAYTIAVNLLPLLAWRGIAQPDQRHLLQTHAASLARDAAACAIAADRLDLAVELLEQGRGVYWSQLLDTRTDLTALEQVAPHLAQQLLACRSVLEHPAIKQSSDLPSDQTEEERMHAARRFDELVEQVRALPASTEFPYPDAFLKPPPLRTLLPGADHDPVAIVNISQWRCDALILTHHGVTLAELPGLTEQQVIDEVNRYLVALQHVERSPHTAPDLRILETAITTTLEWLWDHITAPILGALGHTATPASDGWPRLWWCPTGALTLLPLHAAGRHHTADTVYDRVISSYTPTLRALHHARTRPVATQPTQILIIALPNTPGQNPLPGAAAERDLLSTQFGPGRRTVLTGAHATRAAVLAQLARHRWLHASCHGTQNLEEPAAGGLLPYDWNTSGPITVAHLSAAEHTGGEFAFLSACKTATGGVTSPDEAITVAAAMQHAGWLHVIGTLWSVWDDSATTVTRGVYNQLLHDGCFDPANAAQALHHTIRELRDSQPERPSTWAPFIHAGP